MALFVSGGAGFVLRHLVQQWLVSHPADQAVIVDAAEWDSAAQRFFAGVRERLVFLHADVRQTAGWTDTASGYPITHVVHAAAITPSPEREWDHPAEVLDVNVMGTVNVLEWARRLPGLQRFVYVSSGNAYGEAAPGTSGAPISENDPANPSELYGISKLASELIVRRYGELCGLPVTSVRLTGIFGTMDRATPGRTLQSVPYLLAHLALTGEPILVNSLDGGGDWLHAADVAGALLALLEARRLNWDLYNVASGRFVTLRELVDIVREVIPDLRVEVVPELRANLVRDLLRRLAQWGAYDIARLHQDTGWQPPPLRWELNTYLVYLQQHPEA
jgi:UDP-glucose 4-epimerase